MENFDSLLQRTCDWNTAVGNYKGVGVDAELEGSLLREEVEEIITAIKNKDPKEVVDGVMDVLFVAIGTLHKMGHEFWDFQSEYEAVVDSNFTKFPFTKREDGKVKKSENFKAPELYVYGDSVFIENGEKVKIEDGSKERFASISEMLSVNLDKKESE